MILIDEKFDEKWLDSFREPDGSIILANHPELIKHFEKMLGINKEKINSSEIKNLKDTVNFNFSERYIHKPDQYNNQTY